MTGSVRIFPREVEISCPLIIHTAVWEDKSFQSRTGRHGLKWEQNPCALTSCSVPGVYLCVCVCVCAVFTVTIVSEDGGGVRNINPGSVSMLLWKAQATGQRPPPEVHTTLS